LKTQGAVAGIEHFKTFLLKKPTAHRSGWFEYPEEESMRFSLKENFKFRIEDSVV